MYFIIRDAVAAPLSAEKSSPSHPAVDILEPDILHPHAVRGYAGRAAVQVVQLNIYAKLLDIRDSNVGE